MTVIILRIQVLTTAQQVTQNDFVVSCVLVLVFSLVQLVVWCGLSRSMGWLLVSPLLLFHNDGCLLLIFITFFFEPPAFITFIFFSSCISIRVHTYNHQIKEQQCSQLILVNWLCSA